MRSGVFPGTAGAILRLFSAEKFVRHVDPELQAIRRELAGEVG